MCVSDGQKIRNAWVRTHTTIWPHGMIPHMSVSQNDRPPETFVSFRKKCKFWRGHKRSTSPRVGTTHAAGPNDISQPPESTTFSLDNIERERERDWFSNLCSVFVFVSAFPIFMCLYFWGFPNISPSRDSWEDEGSRAPNLEKKPGHGAIGQFCGQAFCSHGHQLFPFYPWPVSRWWNRTSQKKWEWQIL